MKKENEEKEYKIEIIETLDRIVNVRAKSLAEAIEKVKEQYNNEEIVLDSEDYLDTEFEEFDY